MYTFVYHHDEIVMNFLFNGQPVQIFLDRCYVPNTSSMIPALLHSSRDAEDGPHLLQLDMCPLVINIRCLQCNNRAHILKIASLLIVYMGHFQKICAIMVKTFREKIILIM